MAAAAPAPAMTSFDSLSDEIALEIIKMAAGFDSWEFLRFNHGHDFLIDVVCKVSVRFRRLAIDSSLWEKFVDIRLTILPRDFSKIDFLIRECLTTKTRSLTIWNYSGAYHSLPIQYLIDLAQMYPNLKDLELSWCRPPEENIPAPWRIKLGDYIARD